MRNPFYIRIVTHDITPEHKSIFNCCF